jgi:hypothetical protein
MKKTLLFISTVLTAAAVNAQVIVAGVSPASIATNYNHTWASPADGWSTPDFNLPATFVQDTLKLSDDGTPGLNAQGNPVSASGCNELPAGSLAGKIAVVFRGDGTNNTNNGACQFALKAYNAEQAGAVGVIIINRIPNEVIGMAAGDSSASVTIPVVMLDLNDGLTLIAEMQNGPVVVFMGNKLGLFDNDIALSPSAALGPKGGMIHKLLAQNGTEFNFEVGAKVTNPGNQAQSNVSLNATITDPNGNVVYNNTVSGLSLAAGDTVGIDVFPGGTNTFPAFSQSTYLDGTYTLTYTADLGATDDDDSDNSVEFTFTFNDSLFSYSAIDTSTNAMGAYNFYRPSDNNASFSVCTVLQDPNASRVAAAGVYFAATTAADVSIEGEEISLYLYKWDDSFLDLNDANFPTGDSWTLTEVASGFYNYPNDSLSAAALQGEVVYGAFNNAVVLEDNQRYLACAQTFNLDLFLSYGNQDYTWNTDLYLQPLFPNESDGTYFAVGFGTDLPSAVGIGLAPAAEAGIIEKNTVNGLVYPNPATDNITISLKEEGNATISVTDVAGRIVLSKSADLVNGKSDLNIAALNAGVYVVNVVLDNGKTAQFNVVKK